MDLDRQEVQTRTGSRQEPPQRVPESNPAVLGDWFIYLSVVVLVCGVVVITALNFGATLTSPLVRIPALVGFGLLIPLSADAAVRAWRSAWVWLPIDRPRGLARFVWAVVLAVTFVVSLYAIFLLVSS
jgi:hypothetical protein